MKKGFKSVLALLLVFSMSTPGFAQDANPGSPSRQSSKLVQTVESSPEDQAALLNFWTREQLAAAQPMEMPVQSGAPDVDAVALPQIP